MKTQTDPEIVRLGRNILRLRLEKGQKQAELAYLSGLRPATVSALENGNNPNPGWDILKRLCNVLNTSIHELTVPDASSISRTEHEDFPTGLLALIQDQDRILSLQEKHISLEEAEWLRNIPCSNRSELGSEVYLQILRFVRFLQSDSD
jgi:transcriptional regulator with XRE-family HTH domain